VAYLEHSLAAGGSIGNFIAHLTNTPNTNLLTLLGMIAFLTGVTRAPFTAFILFLEMTDRHSSIFPMMLAAILANSFSRIVSENSFYEVIKLKYLELDKN
jgi:H+/Cl- antiporter ClcA